MELTRLEGGMQMLGPRIGVHDGDCLACSRTLCCYTFCDVYILETCRLHDSWLQP